MANYVYRRGKQYWLRLTIPADVQRLFIGPSGKQQVRVHEPLGTDSESFAEVQGAKRRAVCLDVFAQIRAGVLTTPEAVKAALAGPGPSFANFLEHVSGSAAAQKALAAFGAFQARSLIHGRFNAGGQPQAAETVSQALDAWIAELMRQDEPPRPQTVNGHRVRVRAFVTKHGDVPLTEVTRAMASDFLSGLDVSTGTRNAYATTLKCVFEAAKQRGRFVGDNPFANMKRKAKGESYQPFTVAELQTLFAALPCEVAPKRHTPETALPWVARIAAYTGARLEEIAQLTVADIRAAGANGGTFTVIDIHNGGTNKLKNETSARLVPVHSELVRTGFLKYVEAVKAGPLFPGLKRRASKGNKVGARLGELFRKKLVALGLKREGLCFHSFRHTVAGRLDAAEVRQSDAARVLGHAVEGMSFGIYSQEGPGLKQVAAVVERITYEGLRL
jgi:integrase